MLLTTVRTTPNPSLTNGGSPSKSQQDINPPGVEAGPLEYDVLMLGQSLSRRRYFWMAIDGTYTSQMDSSFILRDLWLGLRKQGVLPKRLMVLFHGKTNSSNLKQVLFTTFQKVDVTTQFCGGKPTKFWPCQHQHLPYRPINKDVLYLLDHTWWHTLILRFHLNYHSLNVSNVRGCYLVRQHSLELDQVQ